MARTRNHKDGTLDEAMTALVQARAILVQNQAAFVQNQAAVQAQFNEIQRLNAERFARIETILLDHSRILADHSRILAEHSRILQTLPDAVREKIGFKAP